MGKSLLICFCNRRAKRNRRIIFLLCSKRNTKKKPVNVYEIPSKFNIDETEYLKLVDALYSKNKRTKKRIQKIRIRGKHGAM